VIPGKGCAKGKGEGTEGSVTYSAWGKLGEGTNQRAKKKTRKEGGTVFSKKLGREGKGLSGGLGGSDRVHYIEGGGKRGREIGALWTRSVKVEGKEMS